MLVLGCTILTPSSLLFVSKARTRRWCCVRVGDAFMVMWVSNRFAASVARSVFIAAVCKSDEARRTLVLALHESG